MLLARLSPLGCASRGKSADRRRQTHVYEGFLLITGCAKSRSSTRAEHPAALDVFFLLQEQ